MEPLLLTISFIGVIIILFSRHYWIGGAISLCSLVIYLLLQPDVSFVAASVLFVGVLLIGFELAIPEGGVLGIIGAVLLLAGLYFTNGNLAKTLVDVLISAVVSLAILLVLIKQGYKLRFGEKIVLENKLTKEQGYSTGADLSFLVGKTGTSQTVMRPAGKIQIDFEEYDAMSAGQIIFAKQPIVVTKVEGNKITVRQIEGE